MTSSLLLLGCGKMGKALAQGWLAHPAPPRLVIIDRKLPLTEKENGLKDAEVLRSIADLPAHYRPDLIVLAVKPSASLPLLAELARHLGRNLDHSALLSVMAGKDCASLAHATGRADMPVIRTIPNIPASVQAATTGIYFSAHVTEAQKTLARDLMSRVGVVVCVPHEEDLRSVTAISGSGSAYVFLLAELLEKSGHALGLSNKDARILARSMIYGAGKLLSESPEEAAELRESVTSPNGTTAAALHILMEEQNWPTSISQAVQAARKRAEELDQ